MAQGRRHSGSSLRHDPSLQNQTVKPSDHANAKASTSITNTTHTTTTTVETDADIDAVLHSGVLFKKRTHLHTRLLGRRRWKPRFFVLTPSKLRYYAFQHGKLRAEIDLSQCRADALEVMPADARATTSRSAASASIWRLALRASPKTRLVLAAGSEREMNEWIDKLSRVLHAHAAFHHHTRMTSPPPLGGTSLALQLPATQAATSAVAVASRLALARTSSMAEAVARGAQRPHASRQDALARAQSLPQTTRGAAMALSQSQSQGGDHHHHHHHRLPSVPFSGLLPSSERELAARWKSTTTDFQNFVARGVGRRRRSVVFRRRTSDARGVDSRPMGFRHSTGQMDLESGLAEDLRELRAGASFRFEEDSDEDEEGEGDASDDEEDEEEAAEEAKMEPRHRARAVARNLAIEEEEKKEEDELLLALREFAAKHQPTPVAALATTHMRPFAAEEWNRSERSTVQPRTTPIFHYQKRGHGSPSGGNNKPAPPSVPIPESVSVPVRSPIRRRHSTGSAWRPSPSPSPSRSHPQVSATQDSEDELIEELLAGYNGSRAHNGVNSGALTSASGGRAPPRSGTFVVALPSPSSSSLSSTSSTNSPASTSSSSAPVRQRTSTVSSFDVDAERSLMAQATPLESIEDQKVDPTSGSRSTTSSSSASSLLASSSASSSSATLSSLDDTDRVAAATRTMLPTPATGGVPAVGPATSVSAAVAGNHDRDRDPERSDEKAATEGQSRQGWFPGLRMWCSRKEKAPGSRRASTPNAFQCSPEQTSHLLSRALVEDTATTESSVVDPASIPSNAALQPPPSTSSSTTRRVAPSRRNSTGSAPMMDVDIDSLVDSDMEVGTTVTRDEPATWASPPRKPLLRRLMDKLGEERERRGSRSMNEEDEELAMASNRASLGAMESPARETVPKTEEDSLARSEIGWSAFNQSGGDGHGDEPMLVVDEIVAETTRIMDISARKSDDQLVVNGNALLVEPDPPHPSPVKILSTTEDAVAVCASPDSRLFAATLSSRGRKSGGRIELVEEETETEDGSKNENENRMNPNHAIVGHRSPIRTSRGIYIEREHQVVASGAVNAVQEDEDQGEDEDEEQIIVIVRRQNMNREDAGSSSRGKRAKLRVIVEMEDSSPVSSPTASPSEGVRSAVVLAA